MNFTEHYKLKQPERAEPVSVNDLNENAAVIDRELHRLAAALSPLTAAISALQTALTDHETRIAALENALFNDISANAFTVRFQTLDGIAVAGVWNKPARRIEC